ncbi:MAG: methyltransferase [Syntrophobacteraceae bacterium]
MSELEATLEQIRRKYKVETVPLKLGGKEMNVLQIADFESYLEDLIETQNVGPMDLPYWAKLWDTSLILAYFLGKQPVVPWRRMLEIGAGVGVVGLYASLCGHNVTITDIEEDALLFAKANVLLNGGAARVQKLDWSTPDIGERYEVIFGSEVIYDRKTYPLLVAFLQKALAPNGTIFLAKNTSLHAPAFFEELTRYFKFKHTVQTVRSGEETQQVSLYAVRFKD